MNEKRLLQYSAFATCFIIINDSKAGAVYTDINPDSVLVNDNEFYNIDIDNNGVIDFQFKITTGSFSTPYFDYYSYFYYMVAAPFMSGNRIAGVKSVISPSYGGFTQYFPFALSEGAMINEDLTFQNNNFQPLAYMIANFVGASQANGGKWFDGLENHFIGVRFYDEFECLHYGWIRCDVGAHVDSLIIKDFAFESKCDVGIIAGDTIGDTTTVGVNNLNNATVSVYNFDRIVYINTSEIINNLEVNIYDIAGQKIFSDRLNTEFSQIELIEPKGTYIVELISIEKKYTKKIFIN